MTLPGNSTVLSATIVVDPAELTQKFRPDCRKWVICFCISMRKLYLVVSLWHIAPNKCLSRFLRVTIEMMMR